MDTATLKAPAPSESVRDLTLNDKCDQCGSQAYYLIFKIVPDMSLELLFCHHHGRRHSDRLASDGWSVIDFTDRLYSPELMLPSN
jgi:hypothetical protein